MLSTGAKIAKSVAVALVTLVVTAGVGEAVLRIKNSDQRNYNIEMWRYARELKKISPDPRLGHVHVPHAAARLQNVDFSINSLGMRGPEPDLSAPGRKKVLLLGSSISLGWGVPEEESIGGRLRQILGSGFEVLNGSVGNFNTMRSITLFEKSWKKEVNPDVVVVNYFLNDAENLPSGTNNFLMRNSQFAVTVFFIYNNFIKFKDADVSSLSEHYDDVYRPERQGYRDMIDAMDRLNAMAREDGFKVVLAMIPDIHQLENYPFQFIHERMAGIAEEREWDFVDFLGDLGGYKGPELWTIPGDPHPNGLVHRLMAERLAPIIR